MDEPHDLLYHSLNEKVFIRLKHNRELRGQLLAYDEHLNLSLGDAEEKITLKQKEQLSGQEMVRVQKKLHGWLFVRGDLVVSVATGND